MSEAQEISIANESEPQIKEEMGSTTTPSCSATSAKSAAHGEDFRTRAPAMAVHGGGRSAVNAFAVPGARSISPAGSCPSRQRGGARRRSRTRDRPRYRAAFGAGTRRRRSGGSYCARHLRPGADRLATWARRRWRAVPQYGRDDELQSDQLGAKYESQLGWIRRRCRRSCRRSDDSTKRPAIDAACRTGCPPTPIPSRRGRDSANRSAIESCGRIVLHQPRCVRPAHRRHRLRRQPEQGIARAAALHPVLRFRIDFPEKWEISNSLQQVVAKAPGANVFMLLQLVEMPRGRNIQEIARTAWTAPVPVRSR